MIDYLVGSVKGSSGNAKVALEVPISLVTGKNTIDLLSLTVGLQVQLSSPCVKVYLETRIMLLGTTCYAEFGSSVVTELFCIHLCLGSNILACTLFSDTNL